ncbi:helix-hairpin-helix domain-containing protein [Albibacterium bauzanense]|uniref:DNA uptake protein ComE-like DNA-binding protein n=1 Tax=Albibacterium bauzanense TaxID=653929 RepID=A0A4R1M3S4_9SPHI|nr:helix-hairpin-helix domain-containing protein [Albibacterium bauzanense]TCK85740.1 DNA uptake protein ComE-like DNA-binding protein [Albibacterium bauzanense]
MGKWFDKHFSMNRKELQGLSFLTVLVIFLWFLPDLYRILKPIKHDPAFALREQEIRRFLAKQSGSIDEDSVTESIQPELEYFTFNPNKLTAEEAKRLGLSDYQIRMIHNYVAKGGRFYTKSDFAKIYAISEQDFQRLSPYINLEAAISVKESVPKPIISESLFTKPNLQLLIELNSTDSLELQELRGIGPVFASRIIRFRDLIGGFYASSQLLEVYGMDEERYSNLQANIYTDSTKVKKININAVSYQELSRHPYISPKQANVIVQYRNQHGNYLEHTDLLNIEILNEEFLRKIAPYLSFTND